jgi:hypothetical protein
MRSRRGCVPNEVRVVDLILFLYEGESTTHINKLVIELDWPSSSAHKAVQTAKFLKLIKRVKDNTRANRKVYQLTSAGRVLGEIATEDPEIADKVVSILNILIPFPSISAVKTQIKDLAESLKEMWGNE